MPLLLLIALTGLGQDGGASRLTVERVRDTPWPAAVGVVEVWPAPATATKFSVSTADGKPVQAQTVWSAGGEPTLIRFNTVGGATRYQFSFHTNAVSASGGWTPEAGVLIETRACAERPVNTLDQVNRLASGASPVYGRSFCPRIFLGMNPHGPSADYVALFSGWFNAPRAGDYGFATASTDASYLEIDGHGVAEWLGRHDPHGGRRGEHSGHIALKSGVHHIDYVQVQFNGEPAAVAAWKPPGEEHFEVIPASAFVPIARFQATRFEPPGSAPAQLYFEWQNLDHCRLGESLVVRTRFRAVDAGQQRSYRWRFDDGDEASGQVVEHIFAEAGLRQVTLTARENGVGVSTNTLRVRISPNWLQREDWRPDIFEQVKNDFLRRDLAVMTTRDLGAVLELADRAEDHRLALSAAQAAFRRADEFNALAYGVAFYRLGLSLQREGDLGGRLAEQGFRLAMAPQRGSPAIAEKARLRLADLLLHCSGQTKEAEKLLAGLSGNGLTADERRLWKLLEGDRLLACSQVEAARKQYLTAGDLVSKPSPPPGLDHAARLEGLSIALQCGQFEDVEHALDRLTFEKPLERLALDTGLVRIQTCLKRKEFQRAFTTARHLLPPADKDPAKSSLLHAVVEAGLALGRTEDAQRALSQLLREFPYSEAAARAKEQWGSRVLADTGGAAGGTKR